METQLRELGELLLDPRPHVRQSAVELVLGLTGSDDGRNVVAAHRQHVVRPLCELCGKPNDSPPPSVEMCFKAVVNLSADASLASYMVGVGVLPSLVDAVVARLPSADWAAMALANLTRTTEGCEKLLAVGGSAEGEHLYKLIDAFCKTPAWESTTLSPLGGGAGKTDKNGTHEGPHLHFVASVLSNVTQTEAGCKAITSRERCVLPRLLPFTQHPEVVRRGGIAAMIKNCCFDSSVHEWLLSDDVGLLPHLLLPLAGPEEFDDDDMNGMPDELQYLPAEKEREPDAQIRVILIEALTQLGATKQGRETLRNKKVYPILREFHKWEKDKVADRAIYPLVQLLIGDESGAHLHQLELPSDVAKKLDDIRAKEDTELQTELAAEGSARTTVYDDEIVVGARAPAVTADDASAR